jgi:hypothetical protein
LLFQLLDSLQSLIGFRAVPISIGEGTEFLLIAARPQRGPLFTRIFAVGESERSAESDDQQDEE